MSVSDQTPEVPRRSFLRQACCTAVGATGMVSALSQLRLLGAMASDSGGVRSAASGDYKALVCIFLNGGNDGNNTVVPYDASSYAAYAAVRGSLAVRREALQPLALRSYADGRSYGLNPDLTGLKALYDGGKLAFLANVGTLDRPLTLAEYRAGGPVPLQLYSHLDQAIQWQSSIVSDPIFRTGWGGRMADLINATNADPKISMSICVGGSSYFQVGNSVAPYSVSSNGAILLTGYNSWQNGSRLYPSIKQLFGGRADNVLGSVFANTTKDAVQDSEFLADVLSRGRPLTTVFPSSYTASRLKMVARLISLSAELGHRRQVFFISVGGFDTHAQQLEGHGKLLNEVGAAMAAFYKSTEELGLQNQVTTFTASDFSRTYNPNGSGTDHAWGNLQWIMGGAVKGGDIYGRMPSLRIGGTDDTGRGAWIPTTSVDEYNATLAKWFGVSDSNLPVVLPNIGRFEKRDLGFMV